ncbi:MAG: hypothetical protein L0207_06640 [Chlamydiae bacterium]|nr:hypothetical protein [Chlamydiota bacterium]
MLQFLRRYQKFFFVIVTILVVISFSFFGTFSTFLNVEEEIPDQPIGPAIDGSVMTRRDLDQMIHLLKSTENDQENRLILLGDSVIEHDFISSSLASMLAERYFEWIRPEIEERIKKAKYFTPYAHPSAPFISANSVWQRFHPELTKLIQELKETEKEVNISHFNLLCKLYLAQSRFPAYMLKQVLLYQMNQYSWIKPDPHFIQSDLSLFGFRSLGDWLGPRFLQILGQFIFNAAILAQQKGYFVSLEEAKAELILQAQKALQKQISEREISLDEAKQYLFQGIKKLGIDEEKAIKIWQKILYFRRLFYETGEGVFLDPLTLNQFYQFSREEAEIHLYELPKSLTLSNFHDLLQLELYLDATAEREKGEKLLEFPEVFSPIEKIEKHYPELVQKHFVLEFSKVTKEEIAEQVSLKETWEWEMQETHFQVLIKNFPVLTLEKGKTKEDIRQALEKIDTETRLKIDQFARLQIVEEHPEWIDQELGKIKPNQVKVGISLRGQEEFLGANIDSNEFLALLEKNDPFLSRFTVDEKIFYRIKVIEQTKEKNICSFAEAKEKGILAMLLDQHFEATYPLLRKKDGEKFQMDDGSWKPLEEVKDAVGSLLYRDVLKSIETHCANEINNSGGISLDEYAKHRFCRHMQKTKEALIAGVDEKQLIQGEGMAAFNQQWKLVKTAKTVIRNDKMAPSYHLAFQMEEGSWSNLANFTSENPCFFKLVSRSHDSNFAHEDLMKVQEKLSIDAQRCLMKDILDLLDEKKAIHAIQF